MEKHDEAVVRLQPTSADADSAAEAGVSLSEIMPAEPRETAGPTAQDVQRLVRQYVEEIKQQVSVPIDQMPRARRPWTLYSIAAFIAALLTFGAIEIGIRPAPLSDTPLSPPPVALALIEGDACTQRQQAILRAITDYTRERGKAPRHLSMLESRYLSVPPVDPISGAPYKYSAHGNRIVLTCPNPDLHAPPPPG